MRSSLPLSLDLAEERLPAQAESTAYFVACEALTNIAKHAQATNASISAYFKCGRTLRRGSAPPTTTGSLTYSVKAR